MSYIGLLNKTCTIQTSTKSQSDTGEVIKAWTDLYTGIKCRKSRNSNPRIYDNESKMYLDEYKIYFLIDQVIEKEHRIIIDGETFEIESVGTDSSEHHKKVFAFLRQR